MGGLEPKTGFAAAQCVAKAPVLHTTPKTKKTVAEKGESKGLHQVKRGDTLFKIANRYGCSVTELKTWNNIRGNRIVPGQKLAVHQSGTGKSHGAVLAGKSSAGNAKKVAAAKHSGSPKVHTYKVRRGDTLWKIAQKFDGITVKDIMKTNRIRKAKDLKPGTTLKIVMDA
jgi:membrane-bound lytic murein transglycosylase D